MMSRDDEAEVSTLPSAKRGADGRDRSTSSCSELTGPEEF
jgi:hypothetical protein